MKLLSTLLLLKGAASLSQPVLIESLESKTKDHKEVFNEISFRPGLKRDLWLMKQSHNGLQHPEDKWDEIKIVVDKTTTPYTASYHQLKNGKEIELKAACYICHSNGPRFIRPNYESSQVEYSLKDKMKIAAMNIRIKSYGVIKMKRTLHKRPLAYPGTQYWQELDIPTCLKCHNEEGYLSRGKLKSQHVGTIAHLTQTRAMPPWPYSLSKEEERKLQDFIAKFSEAL